MYVFACFSQKWDSKGTVSLWRVWLAGRTNFKQGRANPDFSDEQLQLAEQYARLTEKNKGRLELYLEQLLAKQDK